MAERGMVVDMTPYDLTKGRINFREKDAHSQKSSRRPARFGHGR